jgi:hypothetical protein
MNEKKTESPLITSRCANRKRSQVLVDWLVTENYDLAVTITLKRNSQGKAPSLGSARKTFRRIFIDLERRIYGNRCRRKGSRLQRIAFLGQGSQNDHPHIHWAIKAPLSMEMNVFKRKVEAFLRQERLAGTFDVEKIRDTGWIEYLMHHGIEAFEPEMSHLAPPYKG